MQMREGVAMASFDYVKPLSLKELTRDLAQVGSEGAILAGGTDLIVKLRSGMLSRRILFDINDLVELHGVLEDGSYLRIGSGMRMSEVAESQAIARWVPFLAAAARQVGSPQIRNRATLGGNILSASPAADTVPPLMAMGAILKLQGAQGERTIPIETFMKRPGRTEIREGEVLAEIMVPKLDEGCRSHFIKVGRRRSLAISIVNLAGWIKRDPSGVVEDVRIVLGAVAPTAVRARKAEDFLRGKACSRAVIAEAGKKACQELQPISDIRATDEGRRHLVEGWMIRLLEALGN